MGFATLFIGYFLLLNISHYGLTDIIASLIMLLALSKLSWINKDLKNTFYVNFGFIFVSFFGFILEMLRFLSIEIDILSSIIGALRGACIFILTLSLLKGILSLSEEIGTSDITVRTKRNLILLPICYIPLIILELPVWSFLPSDAISVISFIGVIVTVLHVVMLVLNIMLLYTCYMRICMPEERFDSPLKDTKEKKMGFFERSRKERKDALLQMKNKDRDV